MEEGAYIGEIRGFAGIFAPLNWAFCQGQELSIQTYQALYSIIGITYGGNAVTIFKLPNLQGRFPIGVGTSPETVVVTLGTVVGKQPMTLVSNNLPPHSHSASALSGATVIGTATGTVTPKCAADEGDKTTPVGNAMAAVNNGFVGTGDAISNMAPISASIPVSGTISSATVAIGASGQSQGVNVVQPSLAINWVICLQGLYPSRSN